MRHKECRTRRGPLIYLSVIQTESGIMSTKQNFKWSARISVNRRLRVEASKNINSFSVELVPLHEGEVDNLRISGSEQGRLTTCFPLTVKDPHSLWMLFLQCVDRFTFGCITGILRISNECHITCGESGLPGYLTGLLVIDPSDQFQTCFCISD